MFVLDSGSQKMQRTRETPSYVDLDNKSTKGVASHAHASVIDEFFRSVHLHLLDIISIWLFFLVTVITLRLTAPALYRKPSLEVNALPPLP